MSKMVNILVVLIVIDRGIATKISKEVWPWELPVYEAKFGEGACVEVSERECTARLPDAGEEFARLHTAFGIEEDTKQNFADLAYGRGKAGIKALDKVMKSSIIKPKRKKAAKKPPAEKPVEKTEPEAAGNSDPLA